MINRKILLTLLIVLLISFSCTGPVIHYLGDTHQRTSTITEYFDEKTIEKSYRVIGTMANDKWMNYRVEDIRESMRQKAKEVGADGILYLPLDTDSDDKGDNRADVRAKLIKFDQE